ncbi:hypothetical protein QAD02_009762 [Eretmocerus hayati]|uniref:Uncharacterized protein n=1 Tax=Eretmocerus hayati TaxID=131215 RepID=A0ACC2NAL2_9HYME|nr:hypothetical protein QAD02_009762 [Eretmocerus hayati]
MTLYLPFSSKISSGTDRELYIELMQAIRIGNEGLVQQLVNNGAPVNPLLGFPSLTPLHLAVQSKAAGIIKILLTRNADVNAKSWDGDTPLILAAKSGINSLVDILLSHDVRNYENKDHLSHLHIASMRNRVDVVEKLLLINQGKFLNRQVLQSSIVWQGYTPLHLAVYFGCIETVEYLLECGANILAIDSQGFTPLHLADYQRNARIIDILLSAHKNEFKNPASPLGLTHFHIACTRDDTSIIEHFLKVGVDVNLHVKAPDSPWHCWVPINFAVYHGCSSVIQVLLHAGVQLFSSSYFTRLLKYEFMMRNGKIYDPFTVISSRFVDIVPYEKYTIESALYQACTRNDKLAIEKLLNDSVIEAPNVLNKPNWNGSTPLNLALKCNSGEVIEYLLDHGADITIKDNEGKTPVHVAFYIESVKWLQMMLVRLSGKAANVDDDNGLSLFHIVCTTNKLEIVQSFLHSGVDVDAQVWNQSKLWAGFTPLHFACVYFQTEVVKVLLDHGANILVENRMHLNPFELTVEKMINDASVYHGKYFKILETILANPQLKGNKFNTYGISILHGLHFNHHTHKIPVKMLKKILETHQNELNSTISLQRKHNYNKFTPLQFASIFRNVKVAKLLVEYGADPLMVDGEGRTALEYLYGNGQKLNDLLKWATTFFTFKTVNQSSRPSHFHMACAIGRSNVVKRVLEVSSEEAKKIFVNYLDDHGRTPLHALLNQKITRPKSRNQITRLLLKNGANAHARDFLMRTPLHLAYRCGDAEVVKQLINYGAEVNARDIYGCLPLIDFCSNYCAEQISVLLENGADINLVDATDLTCLETMLNMFPRHATIDYENRNKGPESVIVMLKHVKKFQVIGLNISEKNVRAYTKLVRIIGELYDETAFIRECNREIESMMIVKIDNYTTLRDIMTKSPSRMAFHCQNVDLQKMVESNDFCKKFTIYGNLIKFQMKIGTSRRSLFLKCRGSLITLIGIHLPHSCLEMIIQYLSETDQRHIISASQKIIFTDE